jgi:hypothetical protein
MKEHINLDPEEFLPPNVSNFPRYVFILSVILCDIRTDCVLMCYFYSSKVVGVEDESKLKWLWWSGICIKRLLWKSRRRRRKLNSLWRKWFIVLSREHVLCSGAKSIHIFPPRLPHIWLRFQNTREVSKAQCNDHDRTSCSLVPQEWLKDLQHVHGEIAGNLLLQVWKIFMFTDSMRNCTKWKVFVNE